jgi:hypothetical protein
MKERLCAWHCGRTTKEHTRICDLCWSDRESIYLARKAREAAAEKKPLSEARKAALEKLTATRRAKTNEGIAPHGAFALKDGLSPQPP